MKPITGFRNGQGAGLFAMRARHMIQSFYFGFTGPSAEEEYHLSQHLSNQIAIKVKKMEPTKKNARIAGILYLLLIISGMFSLIYVPSELLDWGDASKTVDNISESQLLWKLGIIGNLLCFTCFIFLPFALYRLLSSVNTNYAILMVALAIVSVPISYLNIVNYIDVVSILNSVEFLELYTREQLGFEVMSLLETYDNGNKVVYIFWGLWLFPFGYLVYKSVFLPKFFGIMLMLGCFGYLSDFIGYFLFEGYGKTIFATIAGIPSSIGEIGICLWLLIVGIRAPKVES